MTASILPLSSILPLHIKIRKGMNTLKAIQNCFPPTKYVFLQPHKFPNKKNTTLFLCKSNDQGSESSSQSQPEGDANKQDLLVKIAMLQAQKVRLTDYLDERSAYLTQYAEEANAQFDEIGESTLKDLDEAEARIMEKLDGKMQEFEESSESNRQEIEEAEKMLDDFEDSIDEGRNEGLFFKNLGSSTKKPDDENRAKAKAKAKEEAEKIREIERQLAGSKIRKNVYLGLIVLMGVGIGDALVSAADWRKIAALTVILVALLSQYIYEQGISTKNDKEQ